MAAAIVGTPTAALNNTTYTAEAGSDRAVVFAASNRFTGGTSLTNILWNSITRTPTITGNDASRNGVGITIHKESEIGGASNHVATWGSTPGSQIATRITASGIDQTTTVRASSPYGSGIVTAVALTVPSVSVGDLIVATITNRNGTTYTVNNGYTQLTTGTNGDGGRYITVYKIAVGSSDNVSLTLSGTDGDDEWAGAAIALIPNGGASPATLSSATPSGTLGTSTTAAIGATTDTSSGTFYAVVDSAGNISGITAAQVKAGQNNASASAVSANSVAVSTTSPQTTCTGLTVATLYSYAVVQNSAGGDSNVLTGTFTTAAAAVNPQTRQYGPQGAMRTLLTL